MLLTTSDQTAVYSELVLKTTPPRVPKHQLSRSCLSLKDDRFRDRSLIVVQAPAGFGKTSLLGQWRREFMARGAVVAWVTADVRDDLGRFLHCLVQAVRQGCGRPAFGRLVLAASGTRMGEMEGVTSWLAEVSQTSLDLVLIVDEAERLGGNAFTALNYLLHNAPPNLQVVVGGRSGLEGAVADLADYGEAIVLGAEDLRFRLDETIALLQSRFGGGVDADTAARLHELAEGWPLGLQIVMAALEKKGDLHSAMASVSLAEWSRGDHFMGGLLASLAAADADFLVRIATTDLVHPDLCRALTGDPGAPERLQRLVRETPVFVVGDQGDWLRLHNLARDALRARLEALPAAERNELHVRAMHWLAEHGMPLEAAGHAHAAGQKEMAYELAEHCLYESVTQGYQETVLRWLDLLPPEELQRRSRLSLAAAWALALSERHGEAAALVQRLLESPDSDDAVRYECVLIAAGAAYYADEPDRFVALFKPWLNQPPPLRDPRLLQMHANRQAAYAILTGDPAQARRYVQQVSPGELGKSYRYGARWGEFITGLSYLWEGQGVLAEQVLRPALASADADLGRRHPLACMIASLVAAAVFERDQQDEAAKLLANRLDVLERVGTPETILLGYRTSARIAAAQGVEHRALDLLEVLFAVGTARQLPRLCLASLAEQVRMHAGRFRAETCKALVRRIDEIVGQCNVAERPLWLRSLRLQQQMAHANAAIGAQEWAAAVAALDEALALADVTKLGRWRIELMALKAFALDRMGRDSRALLLEALNLAQTFSLSRTFADAHPALADWVRRIVEDEGGAGGLQIARSTRPLPERPAAAPRAVPSMVLTPKEREVLEHLARNFSNKEIAHAMGVGEETVKWHLKNLFGKLDAGTRKHVVRRAQLLGLLEGLE